MIRPNWPMIGALLLLTVSFVLLVAGVVTAPKWALYLLTAWFLQADSARLAARGKGKDR